MKVIKTRAGIYHTNKECQALDKASRNTKEIELDTAKAWGLEKCSSCSGTGGGVGHNKWSELVNSMRES